MDQNAADRGASGGGSVKRARERMNARFDFGVTNPPPKTNRQPPPPPGEVPRYPGRRQGPIPAALKSKLPTGTTISRPTPAQDYDWPFPGNANPSGSEPSRIPRGPVPQRPPRPSYVPLILDPNSFSPNSPNRPSPRQLQPPQRPGDAVSSPSQRIEAYYEEDSSYQSPTTNERDSQYSSDRPSTVSSTGSIPDFPIPAMPIPTAAAGPPRRVPYSGPPPAVRRGPSSYYSQASFVSPIPEEMPEAMRASGSSHPIASSWGSRPEDIDIDDYIDDIEEEDDDARAYSPASQHSESANLVRQASLGKKARPILTTVGSQDDAADRMKRQDSSTLGKGVGTVRPGAQNLSPDRPLMPQFPSSSDDDDLSSSIQSTESSVRGALSIPFSQSKTFLTSSSDRHNSRIADFDRTSTGLADRIPSHIRPPKLNLDAVRDAEARGSLTSLPDLIRRATRVAQNLEKGRTASRLGLADFLNAAGSGKSEKLEKLSKDDSLSSDAKRRSGSVSDILASFPAPNMLTPTGERPMSRWPTAYPITNRQQDMNYETLPEARSKEKIPEPYPIPDKRSRRCCGMRLWVFVMLLLLIFSLIAAAVIIPVVLLVIDPRGHNNASTSTSGNSSCASTDPCQNGGVSVFTDNACRCICVNGFTGTHCAIQSDAGCASITENLGTNDQDSAATIGDAIPRLFTASSSKFNIPLHDQELLSLFSSNNLSCASENALVTINGQSEKRFFIFPEVGSPDFSDDLPPVTIEKRQIEEILVRRDANPATATQDGIVYQATSTAAASQASTAAATSTSSSSSTATTSPSGLNLTQDTLDFSRIVVLFILEETTSLTSAEVAQKTISTFLYTGSTTNMSMDMNAESGSSKNFTLNFLTFTITLGNGTSLGGQGDGEGGLISSNSTTSTNNTKRDDEATHLQRRQWNVPLS